jgi:hypothetical protein
MYLPREIEDYRNEILANPPKVPAKIFDNWWNHIVTGNLYSLGEKGAYVYITRSRGKFSEKTLVHYALQAEIENQPDMARGFWKRAYEAKKKKDNSTMISKSLKVFLSHAREDKPAVRQLSRRLKDAGFDPWLAEERLLPGQNWELEIEKALRASDVILLCFSEKSVNKEGFVQREFKRAMKYQEEKPEGVIFTIPVRFDQSEIPFSYRELQWVDFPSNYEQLVAALEYRKNQVYAKDKISAR